MKFWWPSKMVEPPARQRLQLVNKEDNKVLYTTREFIPALSYEGVMAQIVFDLMERVEALEKVK